MTPPSGRDFFFFEDITKLILNVYGNTSDLKWPMHTWRDAQHIRQQGNANYNDNVTLNRNTLKMTKTKKKKSQI